MPLNLELRMASDQGRPLLQTSPDGDISQRFSDAAATVVAQIDAQTQSAPVINIFDD